MQNLLDNQISAIEKLRQYKVGALFMEPGTGKTRAAYELVKSVQNIDCILWLTPFQTKQNLADEIKKCGGLDCEIVGIESLSNSDRLYLELYSKIQNKKYFIICDESLKIKNWSAKRTKRIIELGKLCEYKLVLNGTPLSKNLLDIWAQMEFLSPKILNMGISEFYNTFCEWVKITKRFGYRSIVKEFITKYHNVEYLYSLIKFYVYESDLQLDINKQYINIPYEIDSDLKEKYYFLKNTYLDNEKLMAMNNNIFLEMTQKMQHKYCCSTEKFQFVERLIKNNKPEKILIYCKYIISTEECKKRFPNVTVMTYGKNSFGLNLQDYNITIYFDKTFDYAQRLQSEHRTYRVGQLENCLYYDLTGDVGLEKMINDNIKKKQGLLEYFKQKSIEEIKKEL